MSDENPIYERLTAQRELLDRMAFAASVRATIAALPECGPWEYPA